MNTDTTTQAEPTDLTVRLTAICTHCGEDVCRTMTNHPPFEPVSDWYHQHTGREACEVTR